MRMGRPGPATSAGAGVACAGREVAAAVGSRAGREDGELFGEFWGLAMGAEGSFPIAGSDEDFALAPAFFANEFVYRHGGRIKRSV